MWKQMLRFGIVGGLATFVHMVIGFLLIHSGWPPLIANMFAFAIAFLISFFGHLGYSFADKDISASGSLWKFAVVALTAFGCNETLLAALVWFGFFPDAIALWVTTGSAAILTFILSKNWAFSPSRDTGEVSLVARTDAEPSATFSA